ncbi:MAG: DUF3883 domain-containing protein [Bacteroidota bacterium]
MADFWSNIEVELIVSDYFQMLSAELKGEVYSKAEHRRYLSPQLNNRSDGSIEFKHQNISAVLIYLGQPYVKGYLPRYNYQKVLVDKVIDYLTGNINIEEQFRHFADKKIILPDSELKFEKLIVEAPAVSVVSEPLVGYNRNPIKVNYLEREQRNRSLGKSGEELIMQFEKWNLNRIGKEKLADTVEWISQIEGDGAGFDILSKNLNGTDKYIEVKTTKLGKETPFYFSKNELDFSVEHSTDFHLFRLFNFEQEAKMFIKNGNLNTICNSVPTAYKGYF